MQLLFQFTAPGSRPTLASVMDQFGFHSDEVDAGYGVVLVDARTATYVIRVDAGARTRVPAPPGTTFFGDAGIQTFGLPASDE